MVLLFFGFFLCVGGGGGGWREGARVSEFFFTKNLNLKKKKKSYVSLNR